MLAMAVLMGIALDIWEEFSIVSTLLSLQFEQIVINAFFTYSEMNELASKLFLISFEKMRSNYESSIFFTFPLN
jgi:hypothetical protein